MNSLSPYHSGHPAARNEDASTTAREKSIRPVASDPSFARRAIADLFDPPKRLQSFLDRE